jgi:hypothetical protein
MYTQLTGIIFVCFLFIEPGLGLLMQLTSLTVVMFSIYRTSIGVTDGKTQHYEDYAIAICMLQRYISKIICMLEQYLS